MPTGLQEPKKGGFEISLATDLLLSFSPLKALDIHRCSFVSEKASTAGIDSPNHKQTSCTL